MRILPCKVAVEMYQECKNSPFHCLPRHGPGSHQIDDHIRLAVIQVHVITCKLPTTSSKIVQLRETTDHGNEWLELDE